MNTKHLALIASTFLLFAATPLFAKDSEPTILQQLKIYRSIPAAERCPACDGKGIVSESANRKQGLLKRWIQRN